MYSLKAPFCFHSPLWRVACSTILGFASVFSASGAGAEPETPKPVPPAQIQQDPQAAINQAATQGRLSLNRAFNKDAVLDLLETLGIPEASQVLVFSQTSLQNPLIRPSSPRALYFSDDVYVGWVPGGIIELAWPDAEEGTVFYALEPGTDPNGLPKLTTDPRCMNCHEGPQTNDEPGLMIRSVYPDQNGLPLLSEGTHLTTHASPLNERWGGWYVTGQHGDARHLGNQTTTRALGRSGIDPEAGANQADLKSHFNTALYPQATSDIVALMVLEHQVQMHNLYTQGSLVVTTQIARSQALFKELGEPFDLESSQTLQGLIRAKARRITHAMLFKDEAPLTSPITGNPAFQKAFRQNRHEVNGVSLKDFDLETRLFKHRLSYTIHSQAFKQMHPALKKEVFNQIESNLGPDAKSHLKSDEQETLRIFFKHAQDIKNDYRSNTQPSTPSSHPITRLTYRKPATFTLSKGLINPPYPFMLKGSRREFRTR